MEILGFISLLVVGITLSTIGGGGSILTVPILVYLFGLKADLATSYSLFLVGVAALLAAIQKAKMKEIDYKTGTIFAIPAFLGVFLVRAFVMPSIPEIVSIRSIEITKDQLILSVFAIVMLVAAFAMIKDKRKEAEAGSEVKLNLPIIAIEGLVVGGITGFVGAGGGFLIIPALALLAKLPIKTAIGTSLMIITFKSLLGFLGDVGQLNIDWTFLVSISLIAAIGIIAGGFISKKISGEKLKPLFGYFVLVMGGFIMFMQISG